MNACFVCRQPHWSGGVLVPARPDPEQPCEHREATQRFWSASDIAAIARKPPQSAPWGQRRMVTSHLPGHERLERQKARRAAYLAAAGRSEVA
jgi:hypothetical protein